MPGLIYVVTALAIGAFLLVLALRAASRLERRRSVLLHVPAGRAWELIRNFPALHSGHARSRGPALFDRYLLRRGDGETAGSVWRVEGRRGAHPYWTEIEIARCHPGREMAFRLVRDSLGTHRRLAGHLGELVLEDEGDGTTKLTWTLSARLRGVRLRATRFLAPERLQSTLLDLGLRSIKVAVEATPGPRAPGPAGPAPLGPDPRLERWEI